MEEQKAPEMNMLMAILRDASDQSAQLIQDGININWKDVLGDSFLHHAASCARQEITKQLLAAGADINAISSDGRTPLLQALRFNHPEFACWLMDHGADVCVGHINKKNVLEYARTSCFEGIRALAHRIEYSIKEKQKAN